MKRNVKKGEIFSTFKYNGKDSSEMGIYNVSNSGTYTLNIEPTFSDELQNVPGYDGTYYYGSKITGQQFVFTCFCHDLSAVEYDNLKTWLSPRRLGRLILAEQPYKYYLVKPISVSTLSAYPLTSVQTPQNSILGDYIDGDVVYTGNFTLTFQTMGSAYGYGISYYRDDLIYDAKTYYGRDYYYDSGLLYKDMSPALEWNVTSNANAQSIPIYNPGNALGQPNFTVEHTGTFAAHSYLQFNNTDTNSSNIIDISGITGNFNIDISSQSITDENENTYYGRFEGTPLTINPCGINVEIPETFVNDYEQTDLVEYDSFYINNNVVSINPKVLTVSNDLIGQYFCVNKNGGSKILSINSEDNSLTLDSSVLTHDIPSAIINEDGYLTQPAGIGYTYIEVNNIMPTTGRYADVCVVNNVWYLYGDNGWETTNMFSSKEQFKNIYGVYTVQYRMFGAVIVSLDNITITTGTNINYKNNGVTTQGSSVPAFALKAGLQPKYL